MTRIYEEIVDFIASGSTPGEVAAWTPSPAAREEVEDLLHREKAGQLSEEERVALGRYMELEHLMRLAKARARRRGDHE